MSAFAALAGFDGGDEKDIAAAHKEQLQKEEANREAEARAAQAAFADFRAKAGQSSWGDDEDEDEFLSLPVLPVRSAPANRTAYAPRPLQTSCTHALSPCGVRALPSVQR